MPLPKSFTVWGFRVINSAPRHALHVLIGIPTFSVGRDEPDRSRCNHNRERGEGGGVHPIEDARNTPRPLDMSNPDSLDFLESLVAALH